MVWGCCREPQVVVENPVVGPNDAPSTPKHPKGSNRYLYDSNHEQIIGIDNSGSKYAPNRTIQVSTIPYEERLEQAIREEEDARRRRSTSM